MELATTGGEGASWPPETIVHLMGRHILHGRARKLPTLLFRCQGRRGNFPFIPAPAPWMDLPKKMVRSVHPTLAGYNFTSGVFSFDRTVCVPHLLSEPWNAYFYLLF